MLEFLSKAKEVYRTGSSCVLRADEAMYVKQDGDKFLATVIRGIHAYTNLYSSLEEIAESKFTGVREELRWHEQTGRIYRGDIPKDAPAVFYQHLPEPKFLGSDWFDFYELEGKYYAVKGSIQECEQVNGRFIVNDYLYEPVLIQHPIKSYGVVYFTDEDVVKLTYAFSGYDYFSIRERYAEAKRSVDNCEEYIYVMPVSGGYKIVTVNGAFGEEKIVEELCIN